MSLKSEMALRRFGSIAGTYLVDRWLAKHLPEPDRDREVALEIQASGKQRLGRVEIARRQPQEVRDAELDRQRRVRLRSGLRARRGRAAAHRPRAHGTARVGQLVADVAGPAGRAVGPVRARHLREDEPQAAVGAGGSLQALVGRTPDEA